MVQVSLACALRRSALLPWEAKGRPVASRQMRRAMPGLVPQGGTPTRLYYPRGKALGRPKGFHLTSALRSPAAYTMRNKQNKSTTTAPTCVCVAASGHVNGSFFALNQVWVWFSKSYMCLNVTMQGGKQEKNSASGLAKKSPRFAACFPVPHSALSFAAVAIEGKMAVTLLASRVAHGLIHRSFAYARSNKMSPFCQICVVMDTFFSL